MVNIRIDGINYEVKPGKNLLETCLSLGLDIPHFCFHPALGSVGACRLCAVKKFKDQDDKKGRIVMSCMEPATDGLIISIDDPEVKAFRAAVIEGLMTNHPHDCPVCDEGGECHLQDMTVMTGHNYRRFDFKKRTYINQDLGPFIKHEMNRCIQCYRCVRFYRDYAGGKDLNVYASHNHVYFGRFEDGPLESIFSGNLVEVCPTGVFTDKLLNNHFTRKWDLSNSPSVCMNCSVGCNTIVSERYGSVRRIMNRYNGALNGHFICDKGRFGYEFVNSDKRIRKVEILDRKTGFQEIDSDEKHKALLETALSNKGTVAGIGSPRASLESNFALYQLAGKENFYHGISGNEYKLTRSVVNFLQNSGVMSPSLRQIEMADAVIILGEDLIKSAPMMALAVRQAARNKQFGEASGKGIPAWNDAPVRELAQGEKNPVFLITPLKDSLDEIAELALRTTQEETALLGFAVASLLNGKSPYPGNISTDHKIIAERIAESLRKAKNPLVICGITSDDEEILHAGMNLATALLSTGKKVMFASILPESNSMGLAFIPGKPLDEALSIATKGKIDTLIILENDLYLRAPKETIDKLFEKCGNVIVLDHSATETTTRADMLLPASPFPESEGTIVNYEGRAQRYYKAVPNKEQVMESWQWLKELQKIKDNKQEISRVSFEDIVTEMVSELPALSKIREYMPGADFRMLSAKIPRQTMRNSGRTAINAHLAVSEPRVPQDNDSPLAFSMEGRPEDPPSSLVPFYWTPGWNSVQAFYKYLDEPNGSMKGGDPGIRLFEPAESHKVSYFRLKSGQGTEFE